jgi:hypothetical protein
MGRLQKTGISQKTCHSNLYSKLSGRKAPDHILIPSLNFPIAENIGFTDLKN